MRTPLFRLRDAVAGDLDPIVALDTASFKQPWSRDSFERALADVGRSVVVVLEREAGAAELEPAGTAISGFGVAWFTGDEGEIGTLAVAPEARGGGFGESIIRALLSRLQEHGVSKVFLEVRPSNPARKLYKRVGFVEVGERKNYYADGESALLLRFQRMTIGPG